MILVAEHSLMTLKNPSLQNFSFRRVECSRGVQLAVHHLGGLGPPLILLAATGFFPKAYVELINGLQQTFTCFGIDLRGHGDSTSGSGTDLVDHGEDIATVVRLLGLRGGVDGQLLYQTAAHLCPSRMIH